MDKNNISTSEFEESIKKFNAMYKMPVANVPTLKLVGDAVERLTHFKNILTEELNEVDDIIDSLKSVNAEVESLTPSSEIDILKNVYDLRHLTNIADWLGDIQVYCASEMLKFGIPINETLRIIMDSNFSKLDENGLPIYDERNKVLKGPNYYKPEPKISEMLRSIKHPNIASFTKNE